MNILYEFAIYTNEMGTTYFDKCEDEWKKESRWETWSYEDMDHSECETDDEGECDPCYAEPERTYFLFEKFEEISSRRLNEVDLFESSPP